MTTLFNLKSSYKPSGDQPKAIDQLVKGIEAKHWCQVLLGITGSGKTFTMANVIQQMGRPALILAHNKTLAAQLYQEFREFFPENAVEYFVSYYDYYQPEAYLPRSDTYIEKDMSINDRIDQLRIRATTALLERRDVVLIASVSCIYGLGSPEFFSGMRLSLRVGEEIRRDRILLHLVAMQYKRNEMDFARGTFRLRGDILEVFPSYEENIALRIEFFGDEIERISRIDSLTGNLLSREQKVHLYPGSHHVTPESVREDAIKRIQEELKGREQYFAEHNLLIEQQRIHERTCHDLERIKQLGFCKGIENYSRHFSGRQEGEPPDCLLDYFPDDFLIFIDESHQTIPQLRAMHHGDRSRKDSLVRYGFRLPSAYDNRPLTFEEFTNKVPQCVCVSATPGEWEHTYSHGQVVEQIIRPTGLLDPEIEVRPASTQVDDCIAEIRKVVASGGKVLVTTLTKRLSEELTGYLQELSVRAKYLHSDIDTVERMQLIEDLRKGSYDVLVGINLLREGLDIPEVCFVAILDADKEGFLRSETSLIQTCGRAARNANGYVIMYADRETQSMRRALRIMRERRAKQQEHNKKHGITPRTIYKNRDELFPDEEELAKETPAQSSEEALLSKSEIEKMIEKLRKEMHEAANQWKFEEAADIRDRLRKLEQLLVNYG